MLSSICCFAFFFQTKKSKGRERASSCSKNGEEPSDLDSTYPGAEGVWGGAGGSKANKKKKKKMQKVNAASLLGFTVNAADRPNMGEIQSVQDTS